MIIALSGAHRTGKTTLARHYANRHEHVTFCPVSISDMQKKMGYKSSNQTYAWAIRQKIQTGLLEQYAALLDSLDKHQSYILDRSPLDLIIYLIRAAPKHMTEDDSDFIMRYISQCLELNARIELTMVLRPGIPLIAATTSAPAVAGDLEIFTFMLLGLIDSYKNQMPSLVHIMPRYFLSLEQRCDYIEDYIAED